MIYTLHRQHTHQAVMFCLVHKVLYGAVLSLQSCFEIYIYICFIDLSQVPSAQD